MKKSLLLLLISFITHNIYSMQKRQPLPAILFAEWKDPQASEIELFSIPFSISRNPGSPSTIALRARDIHTPLTPSKNSYNFGDESMDSIFDALKNKLPQQDPGTIKTICAALLAKKIRTIISEVKNAQDEEEQLAHAAKQLSFIEEIAKDNNIRALERVSRELLKSSRDLQDLHIIDTILCKNYIKPAGDLFNSLVPTFYILLSKE